MHATPGLRWTVRTLSALWLIACESDFAPPSQLHSVRVLGVRSDPASGTPGDTAMLELLAVDARPDRNLERATAELQIAWLAGCHNPPSRQFFACYPLLQGIAARLAKVVAETDSARLPAGSFGTGPGFSLPIPTDQLARAPRSPGDPVHFGVSFTFFAVCAGELRARPDFADRIPLECVDRETGQAVDPGSFVTGFATLYTYEGQQNQNPELVTVELDGSDLPRQPCTTDAECIGVAGAGRATGCSALGQCARIVRPCVGQCSKLLVLPDVSASSAEPLPEGGREVVWANYYATAGEFETSTQLVHDRAAGFIADPGALWQPPAAENDGVRLWVTLHDQRGGSAFHSLDVIVRAEP